MTISAFNPEAQRRRSEAQRRRRVDIAIEVLFWILVYLGGLIFSRFNDDIFNSEDQTLRFVSGYKTARSVWALNADLERDSTRTSELTDTGNFEVIATRLRYSLRPSYSYQVSQRDLIRLDVGFTDVSYDAGTLTDYRYFTAAGRWERSFSQLTTLSLSANAARQETENDVESDSYSLQAGVSHSFSPRLEISAHVGPRFSSDKLPTGKQSGVGVQSGARVRYDMDEQTSVSASATHSVEPSGGGSLRDRRRFSISARHRYLPRLAFAFSADYQEDSDPNGNNAASDRTYFSVSPSVTWQMKQDWDISAFFRYRQQEFSGGSVGASNSVILSLNYHPRAWFLAR